MTQKEICEKEGPHFKGGSILFPRIAPCCVGVWQLLGPGCYDLPGNPKKQQIIEGKPTYDTYYQLITLALNAYWEEMRHPCRAHGPHLFFTEDGSIKLNLDCRCKNLWSIGRGGVYIQDKTYPPKV